MDSTQVLYVHQAGPHTIYIVDRLPSWLPLAGTPVATRVRLNPLRVSLFVAGFTTFRDADGATESLLDPIHHNALRRALGMGPLGTPAYPDRMGGLTVWPHALAILNGTATAQPA